jgi:hypothetical protein
MLGSKQYLRDGLICMIGVKAGKYLDRSGGFLTV